MDRLDAIHLFVRLVECGSFSAVGREVGIGQPAVSKQISALERHLGAQLVLRTSRQIVITEAGQTFYESAKHLLDDFDAVETSVGERQQFPKGLVRVNTAPAHGRLCVTPLLPEFFKRYPDIEIEMSVSERNVDLVGEGVDLAIRHGRLIDSSLTVRKLSEVDMVLVASPAYLSLRGVPTRLADLDKHTGIVFAKDREPRPWVLKNKKQSISYAPRGSFISGDAEQNRAAVLCGLGITQAPLWLVADEIRSGQVEVLLPELQPGPLPINLVYPAGRRIPKRVRVFIDYLVSEYRHQKF
jgi:DNA-binding transcriptional LysR family regulator